MNITIRKILVVAVFIFVSLSVKAQCAMCTATANNSLEEGSTAAKGLNNGILYMFAMIFLFPTIIFVLYKKRKKFLDKFDEN